MEKTGGSRLLQMQARFQQRQMMEKEQKMVAVYEAQQARALTRVSGSHGASASASVVELDTQRQGKVRQMFEERRTKAGIDKSYPLQPIQNNAERQQAKKPLTNGYGKVALSKTKATERKPTRPSVNNGSHSFTKEKSELANGNGDFNHNTHFTSKQTSNNNSWSHETRTRSTDRLDGLEQEHRICNLEDETFPEVLSPSPSPRIQPTPPPRVKANAVTEKRSPTVNKPTTRVQPQASTPVSKASHASSRNSTVANTTLKATPSDTATGRGGEMIKGARQPASAATAKGRGGVARATASSGGAGAGEPCSVCGRKFASDRIQKHEEICKRSNTKKRKPYDALKHRLEGTEAVGFIKQIRKLPPPGKAASAKTSVSGKPLNNNWRQKHEDFIKAIRAAKQVQAHIASGGKLSDLPPPPPSENPDYVQCPHCGRRFNQAAADRHIPKCKDYQFNKPKRR